MPGFPLERFFQEFKQVCPNLSSAQVAAAFAKFDLSGDDTLNYQEFCGMMNSRRGSRDSRRGSKDVDGNISCEEIVGEEDKNEKIFKFMDENHDGKITKAVRYVEI